MCDFSWDKSIFGMLFLLERIPYELYSKKMILFPNQMVENVSYWIFYKYFDLFIVTLNIQLLNMLKEGKIPCEILVGLFSSAK